MSTYLLLRDNKESGPYSLEELVARGLKAYDLIWVKNKSAAWRYPGELPELKPYAPAVEEQPYDRFFKRDPSNNQENRNEVRNETAKPQNLYERPAESNEPKKSFSPSRSVYVNLPNSKPAEPRQTPSPTPSPVEEPSPTISVSENPAAAQIKYSQPLDEIKEMYVKTLKERKQKIALRTYILKSMRRAAVIIVLVACGVFAGFMLRSDKDGQELQASSGNTSQEVSAQNTLIPEQFESETIEEQEPAPITLNPQEKKALDKLVAKSLSEIPVEKKASKQLMVASQDENTRKIQEFQSSFVNPETGERGKRSREESRTSTSAITQEEISSPIDKSTRDTKRSGIYSMVDVKSNDYYKVAFGGIRDLELTVSNNSEKHLEEVLVELQYIKPNEQPLRTENIRFKSMEPNSTATIRVPDTNRGVNIRYRIIHISE